MHPIIEDHLLLTEPLDSFALYERAHSLFDEYGMENAHTQFEDLMITSDGAVDGVTTASTQSIYNLTVQVLDIILESHQVGLTDEASLKDRVEVLEFIKAIEATELLQEMLDALESPEMDNLDKFIRCMWVVSGVEECDSAVYLKSIPDCVITTMVEYVKGRMQFEAQTEELEPREREAYRELDKFARTVGGEAMACYKYLFEDSGVVDMPFAHYFGQYKQYLMSLKVEDLVYECIGFSILSSDAFDDPAKVVLETMNHYVADLDVLTSVQMSLQQALLQYRSAIGSGVTLVD